jgi:hypothetical protein
MKKEQTMSFRIDFPTYDKFEVECRNNRVNISDVMRQAVNDYLHNFGVQSKDNLYLPSQRGATNNKNCRRN